MGNEVLLPDLCAVVARYFRPGEITLIHSHLGWNKGWLPNKHDRIAWQNMAQDCATWLSALLFIKQHTEKIDWDHVLVACVDISGQYPDHDAETVIRYLISENLLSSGDNTWSVRYVARYGYYVPFNNDKESFLTKNMAFQLAIDSGNMRNVLYLMYQIDHMDGSHAMALYQLASLFGKEYNEILYLLLTQDVTIYRADCNRGVMESAREGNIEAIKTYVRAGFYFPDTVMMCAAEYGELETMEWAHDNNAVIDNTLIEHMETNVRVVTNNNNTLLIKNMVRL